MNTVWSLPLLTLYQLSLNNDGVVFSREDVITSHEEADVIIIHQMVKAAASGVKIINIVCEDTDVFVLLLHFYTKLNLTCHLTMEGPSAERTTVGHV